MSSHVALITILIFNIFIYLDLVYNISKIEEFEIKVPYKHDWDDLRISKLDCLWLST